MASGFSGMRLRRVTTPSQAVGGGGDHDRWYGVSAHRPRSVAPYKAEILEKTPEQFKRACRDLRGYLRATLFWR